MRLEARCAEFAIFSEYIHKTCMCYDTAKLLPAADKDGINAGMGWSAGPWLIQIAGKNLAEERYEDFNGFPHPGRSFFASVIYTFSLTPTPQKE